MSNYNSIENSINYSPRVRQPTYDNRDINYSPRVRSYGYDDRSEDIEPPRERRREEDGREERHGHKHHNEGRKKDRGPRHSERHSDRPPEQALVIREHSPEKDEDYSQSDRNYTQHGDDRRKRRSDRKSKPVDEPQNSSGYGHRDECESQNDRRDEPRKPRSLRRPEETERYRGYPQGKKPVNPKDIKGSLPPDHRARSPSPQFFPPKLPSKSEIKQEIEEGESRTHNNKKMEAQRFEEEKKKIDSRHKRNNATDERVSRYIDDTQKKSNKKERKPNERRS